MNQSESEMPKGAEEITKKEVINKFAKLQSEMRSPNKMTLEMMKRQKEIDVESDLINEADSLTQEKLKKDFEKGAVN
ncbi:MAG: hypothetical protein ABI643_00575 [Candidatus Doudnabacteria bacterium]